MVTLEHRGCKDDESVGCEDDAQVLRNRWIPQIKDTPRGSRYKAQLAAKGLGQKSGLEFDEMFLPVARYETARLLLAFSAVRKMHSKQFDVKTASWSNLRDITMDQEEYAVSSVGCTGCDKLRGAGTIDFFT